MSGKFTDAGVTATYVVKTREKPTLEYALSLANVDSTIWDVERFEVNEWEGFRKNKDVDITFNEGVMDGYSKDNGVLIVQLWQIKVFFRRKIALKTIIPPIAPIVVNTRAVMKKITEVRELDVALVIPDIHFGFRRMDGGLDPFHDERALSIVLNVAKELQPNRIIILGDVLDLPDWSDKFIREPDFQFLTQPAMVAAARFIGKLRELCPDAQIDYLEGNHEQRLLRLIMAQLPMAFGLTPVNSVLPALSVPSLLGLEGLGVVYHGNYPNGRVWINENVCCVHGDIIGSRSGETCTKILRNVAHSIIFGHIHRHEEATETRHHHDKMRTYTAYSPGCLCRIDGVVPGRSNEMNWQQGFGIVHYGKGNGPFHIAHIPIFDGKAIFNGRLYRG